MFNDRPIESEQIREAFQFTKQMFDYYDLAGGIYLIDSKEWAWAYQKSATWNAFIDDPEMPLGFRIRARQNELGTERAKELIEGTAFVLTSMQDFGNQTRLWAGDMIKMLRKAGISIQYKPFNGNKLPRLEGMDLR